MSLARSLLGAAAIALASGTLSAQQPTTRDTTARDTTGRARRDTSRVQQLAPTVVTGTRLTEVDERTPVQVDVIRPGASVPGPTAASAALERLPGVTAFDDQGTRLQPELDIRGFTLSPVVGVPQGVSVFLDGVRINEPDAQEVNFDLIPMDAVARAELVRGPATLLGKNALAGALVLFTQRGGPTPELHAQLETGAFGYRGGVVTGGGTWRGVDGFLVARATEEDGYREDTPARTRMVFANLGRKGDSSDFAFTTLYAHDRLMQAGSLPESWMRVDPSRNFTPGDYFIPTLWHFAARGDWPLGAGRLRANAFDRRNDTEQFNVNVDAPSTDAFVNNHSWGGAMEWSVPTHLGARPFSVTAGAEYSRNDVTYRIYGQPTPGAPLDSSCDQQSGLCENARVPEDDAALFLQAVLEATPKLSFTASARGDYVRTPFRDLRAPENDGTNTYWRFSPRLGVNYTMSETLRGYANVSTGFRSPAALELACADVTAPCSLPSALGDDPHLDPVTVTDYETGFDWEPSAAGNIDFVVYREDVRNEIAFVASTLTAGFFKNIPRTRRQGIEVSGALRLPAGLRAHASYSLVDATYRSTVLLASALPEADSARPGDVFPLSPRHRGSVGLTFTQVIGPSVVTADVTEKLVSSQYLQGNDANVPSVTLPSGETVSGRIGGYAATALHLRYERSAWAVDLHVANLFDQRYATFGIFGENPLGPIGGPEPSEPALERFLNPSFPRAITLSVEAKF